MSIIYNVIYTDWELCKTKAERKHPDYEKDGLTIWDLVEPDIGTQVAPFKSLEKAHKYCIDVLPLDAFCAPYIEKIEVSYDLENGWDYKLIERYELDDDKNLILQ